MEAFDIPRLEDAAIRLRIELASGRNDGWTEAMMQSRLESVEHAMSSYRDVDTAEVAA